MAPGRRGGPLSLRLDTPAGSWATRPLRTAVSHLTPARELELDAELRKVGLTAELARMGYEPGWYEEDCSAYAVIYAWPELFPNTLRDDALESLTYWCRSHAERSR